MAHVISDECVSCGACESECPVGAIAMGDDHMQISADVCVDCGACESACPVGAIAAEQSNAKNWLRQQKRERIFMFT